ncbi:hypothetical protein SAMN04488557_0714 [Hyphomicrobium facile]|uniref:Uncharacterized protein n=1 Tax=Hyphomicrobium facile TaxID=51670 RepID=A0A1I7MXW6_9HYPH|nr:hypothetical protein SAMN04488557_0714 [Hyphomicrobium facile]
MSPFSQSIAQKLRIASSKELAERYARRQQRASEIQDRRGRTITVVNFQRGHRSNGLLDD